MCSFDIVGCNKAMVEIEDKEGYPGIALVILGFVRE